MHNLQFSSKGKKRNAEKAENGEKCMILSSYQQNIFRDNGDSDILLQKTGHQKGPRLSLQCVFCPSRECDPRSEMHK